MNLRNPALKYCFFIESLRMCHLLIDMPYVSVYQVRLIASVPGYHQTHKLKKWGHMKLRAVLDEHRFEEEFKNSPLVYQVFI